MTRDICIVGLMLLLCMALPTSYVYGQYTITFDNREDYAVEVSILHAKPSSQEQDIVLRIANSGLIRLDNVSVVWTNGSLYALVGNTTAGNQTLDPYQVLDLSVKVILPSEGQYTIHANVFSSQLNVSKNVTLTYQVPTSSSGGSSGSRKGSSNSFKEHKKPEISPPNVERIEKNAQDIATENDMSEDDGSIDMRLKSKPDDSWIVYATAIVSFFAVIGTAYLRLWRT